MQIDIFAGESAAFVNTLIQSELIETGDNSKFVFWCMLLVFMGIGLMAVRLGRVRAKAYTKEAV